MIQQLIHVVLENECYIIQNLTYVHELSNFTFTYFPWSNEHNIYFLQLSSVSIIDQDAIHTLS